ncbi:hypothetical protein ACHQM5_019505 [Ranunculus cassubicifolius]
MKKSKTKRNLTKTEELLLSAFRGIISNERRRARRKKGETNTNHENEKAEAQRVMGEETGVNQKFKNIRNE